MVTIYGSYNMNRFFILSWKSKIVQINIFRFFTKADGKIRRFDVSEYVDGDGPSLMVNKKDLPV